MELVHQDNKIIDAGLNGTFAISQKVKATLIGSTIMGLCCHGYSMTNLILQHDTIPEYADGTSSLWVGASTGRWLLGVFESLSTHIKTPFLTGLLIIIIVAIMAVMINETLEIESIAGCILVGILLESFPSMVLFHTLRTVAYPIAALFAVLAVFISKKKNGWIFGGIIMGLSISIYPPMVSVSLILIILVIIKDILIQNNNDNRQFLKHTTKYIIMIAISGVILLGGTKIVMAMTKAESSDYMGAADAISGKRLQYGLLSRIISCYSTFYRLLYSRAEIYPSLRWLIVLICLIIGVSIVYLFFLNKMFRNPLQSAALVVLIALIPQALVTMNLISDGFAYRAQHRLAFVFIYISGIMFSELIYKQCIERKGKKEVKSFNTCHIFSGACICIIILSVSYMFYDNAYYFNEALITKKDQALMTRIMVSLKEEDGFKLNSSPVYFTTYWDEDTSKGTSPLLYSEDFAWNMPTDGETHMIWFTDALYKAYMKTYLGVELQDAGRDIYDKIDCDQFQLNKNSKYADSSLECGDYNIVKVDDTYVVIIRTKIPKHYDYSK